jgi:hypothetical protein
MSGAVVYTAGTGGTTASPLQTTRYGVPLAIALNAVVPRGAWYVMGSFNIVAADGTTHAIPGGYVESDGVNVTAVAATTAIPVGMHG